MGDQQAPIGEVFVRAARAEPDPHHPGPDRRSERNRRRNPERHPDGAGVYPRVLSIGAFWRRRIELFRRCNTEDPGARATHCTCNSGDFWRGGFRTLAWRAGGHRGQHERGRTWTIFALCHLRFRFSCLAERDVERSTARRRCDRAHRRVAAGQRGRQITTGSTAASGAGTRAG